MLVDLEVVIACRSALVVTLANLPDLHRHIIIPAPSLSGGIFGTIFSSVELIICAGPICASSSMLFYSYTNDLFPFHSK